MTSARVHNPFARMIALRVAVSFVTAMLLERTCAGASRANCIIPFTSQRVYSAVSEVHVRPQRGGSAAGSTILLGGHVARRLKFIHGKPPGLDPNAGPIAPQDLSGRRACLARRTPSHSKVARVPPI